MKIASYNVNGVNGRLPVLLRWLEETQPDVACLQELKAPNEKFPEKEIQEAGYHAVWLGQKSWNGVAILSKSEISDVQKGLPGDDNDEQSRYIQARINEILVCCLYLPNGNPYPSEKFEYKLRWFERLAAHAELLYTSGQKVCILGDFNVMPTELDVYKPEKWKIDALFRLEVRDWYQELMNQGWLDSIRRLFPDEVIYTFWDYFRNAFERNAGLRIDHILLNDELKPLLKNAGVDKFMRGWEKSSDHAPVWVELQ